MSTEELLFCLLRNEICGEELPKNFNLGGGVKKLLRLSNMHDIAHLIGDALLRNNLLSETEEINAFREPIVMAVLRYEQQAVGLKDICQVLEKEKIGYMPLKGAVIRGYYPEPWMRTCCDIDVLIHEKDIETAKRALTKSGFITDGKKHFHDVHFCNNNINLELHFSICENMAQTDTLLRKVWDYAEKVGDYEYRQAAEYFVFHHIAHMAYHFLSGGCGIRPFIDLCLMRQNKLYDEEKLLPLLEKSCLVKFYRVICKLNRIWFNGEESNALSQQVGNYILSGGVYGSASNENKIGAAAHKGKIRYLLHMAFPSYAKMCILYPFLKKHKILLPFCYIRRFFAKAFGKDRKKVRSKIKNTFAQSEKNIAVVADLLGELDLHS